MREQTQDQNLPLRSLNIGLVAITVTDKLVFVRVPNERGRWMLVDRCVVEVDCPLCKAVAGEPCKNWQRDWRNAPPKYGTSAHVDRKTACQKLHGRSYGRKLPPYKTHLRLDDIEAAGADMTEEPEHE